MNKYLKNNVNNRFGVPCSNLKTVLNGNEIPCTSEEEAFAIAFGASLVGAKSTVYVQNTGFATCVNVIMTLYKTCAIHLPYLIISNRTKPEYHSNIAKILNQLLLLVEYDKCEVITE
jgi:sulfopyruvate decarboxylase TPP-binding subunit